MKKPLLIALAGAIAACTCGCTTFDVKKVNPDTPAELAPQGVKYSLPKPFLQMTPSGDGSVTCNVVYLPDPDNTYAVSAESYMAAHTLELTLDSSGSGILTKVNFNPDTSAVASQAATSAGNVASAFETAATQRATAEQTKLATAEQAVLQAQATVEADQAKLDKIIQLNQAGANPKIDENQPRIDLAVAEAALRSAQNALANLKFGSGNAGGGGPMPAKAPPPPPPGQGKVQPNWVKVYGPVLYSITATPAGGVKLTPVPLKKVAQRQYYTTTRPSADATSAPPTISPITPVSLTGNPSPQFDITLSKSIIGISGFGLVLNPPLPNPPVPQPAPSLKVLNGNKQIHVSITTPAAGFYTLEVKVKYLDSNNRQKDASTTVDFQIIP
jgi:hypothetical protein